MLRVSLFVGLGFVSSVTMNSVQAADYGVDSSHSNVRFTVTHLMVSDVSGDFKDFGGSFSFDPADAAKAKGKFFVKTASVDTKDKKRDEHLGSSDFFDSKKYPEFTIEITKLAPKAAGDQKNFVATTQFAMHGKTKEVPFDVVYRGSVKDPWGNQKAGFKISGKINRKDFDVSWNKALDGGGVVVGEEVTIDIQLEAVVEKKAAK